MRCNCLLRANQMGTERSSAAHEPRPACPAGSPFQQLPQRSRHQPRRRLLVLRAVVAAAASPPLCRAAGRRELLQHFLKVLLA